MDPGLLRSRARALCLGHTAQRPSCYLRCPVMGSSDFHVTISSGEAGSRLSFLSQFSAFTLFDFRMRQCMTAVRT